MEIIVIGATGMAGSKIVAEALSRGHRVKAIARSEEKLAQIRQSSDLTTLSKDAFKLTASDLERADVVVDAFATAPSQAYLHVDLAAKLVAYFRGKQSPRLLFILGAGSLKTGSDQHLAVKDLEKDPSSASFIAVPQNQLAELNFLRDVKNVNWVGISPGLMFIDGPATDPLIGVDELQYNAQGKSETTSGTIAKAVLDEIEHPKHRNQRFTVANK
ncbi:NAD(P)-dependent oxidoreductase [Lacticaseibacillus pantheris]|uniref:NAD(P)-dependent oxidoreductase n=1 Tax=Lacticaseibacillus pantheris TaxID=171523 RepID=UPI00265B6044|nr:NAD(P)H-binding protein [Lacticaseibacillus pantheris]WKF85845.1 NAD(P)H-binding protein [Lacticaseibacillus pantheris]